MSQRSSIDNQRHDWVSAAEAVRLLGVKRATLYAYASRGLVRSAAGKGRDRTRLYAKEDLERLRTRSAARAGHAAVAAGALRWGEPVLETTVGTITDDGPFYRGHSAVTLARDGASFEQICDLLWNAECPLDLAPDDARLGVSPAPIRALLRQNADPIDAMLITVSVLAAGASRADVSVSRVRELAPALVRRLIASCALATPSAKPDASLEAHGAARALLIALGGRTTAANVAAITEALVLTADHELNASTFAARVTASADATLPACIASALAALSGPRHGAETVRVEALLGEVARPERAAAVISARLERGESVPGFGHRLYPKGDPRGARLLAVAERLSGKSRGVRVVTSVVNAMELAARERPTIDIALVALAAALGLRRGAPLAIFACGRLAGWIAHVIEQRAAGFLLRPRARYVGP